MSDRMSWDAGSVRDDFQLRPRSTSKGLADLFYGVHPTMIARMQTNAIARMLPLVGYPKQAMGLKQTVSANVQRLLDYAADRQQPYATAKALAIKAGLTPSTVGHILKAETAAKIDTLEAIAKVYKLEAWMLQVPNLDPANPPVLPYSETERALYWRIQQVARAFLKTGGEQDDSDVQAAEDGSGKAVSTDSHSPVPRQARSTSSAPPKRKRHKA